MRVLKQRPIQVVPWLSTHECKKLSGRLPDSSRITMDEVPGVIGSLIDACGEAAGRNAMYPYLELAESALETVDYVRHLCAMRKSLDAGRPLMRLYLQVREYDLFVGSKDNTAELLRQHERLESLDESLGDALLEADRQLEMKVLADKDTGRLLLRHAYVVVPAPEGNVGVVRLSVDNRRSIGVEVVSQPAPCSVEFALSMLPKNVVATRAVATGTSHYPWVETSVPLVRDRYMTLLSLVEGNSPLTAEYRERYS